MRADDFRGDGETEPGAAAPYRPLEGLEQIGARSLRHAGAGVADAQGGDAAPPLALDPDAADHRRVVTLADRLQGVAAEIHEHAEELFGIGINLDALGHPILPLDALVAG